MKRILTPSLGARVLAMVGGTLLLALALAGTAQIANLKDSFAGVRHDISDVLLQSSKAEIERLRQDQRVKAEGLGRLLAEIAPEPIQSFNPFGLQVYADKAIQDADIASVEFKSADGKDFAKAVKQGATAGQSLSFDITADGNKLGQIVISLSPKRIEGVVAGLRESADRELAGLQEQADSFVGRFTMMTALGFALLAAIIATALGVLLRRLVLRPVSILAKLTGAVASGDTTQAVPYGDRQDEIGALARSVRVFTDNALEMASLRTEQEARDAQAQAEKHAMMEATAAAFDAEMRGIVEQVVTVTTAMRDNAQVLTDAARDAHQQVGHVSNAASQASGNVETAASATRELSSAVEDISRRLADSASIADAAVSAAGRTNEIVKGLSGAAQKIDEVVGLIQSIASQTNLLALNATIEAARAGDAGKGFAIVASEVKNLATQTSKATTDIQEQVSSMQAATSNAVQAIRDIAEIIDRMSGITNTIASAVDEQRSAAVEIARNLGDASDRTHSVSDGLSQVNHAAGTTDQRAADTGLAAEQLVGQATQLRQAVDGFVGKLRAVA